MFYDRIMDIRKIDIEYKLYSFLEELSEADRELSIAAIGAMRGAYAPYSGFNVGAAIRLGDGTVVTGANQENAAFPSGLCAERTALFYAGAEYPDKSMESIAIAASQNGELCAEPASPCGACRQVMAQYQTKSGRPLSVILVGRDSVMKFEKVDDLLPLIFNNL